tara:strand:+ start:2658 stop:2954 length:297 start_codon:yes stop_codon:yes gene_type:complete
MGILLTTVNTVTINDLGGRTFTHPLVAYDLTGEYEYSEIRSSADLGNALDSNNVSLVNNGVVVSSSADLKKIQPEPNADTGGGSSFANIWAANTLNNC